MKKKGGKLKWIIIVCVVLIIVGALAGGNDKEESDTGMDATAERSVSNEKEERQGVTNVEVQKENKYGSIEDFSYSLDGNKILLDSYSGKDKILEIKTSYEVDGMTYETDISGFQVRSNKVETVIFGDGFTEVNNSVFNSCDALKIYFPKSMTVVYDNTLAYLNPDDGETIKVYYAGTQDEWAQIFQEYKRTKFEDAESPEDKGKSIADKLNEVVGMEYDSSDFEFFFSASPEELKEGD